MSIRQLWVRVKSLPPGSPLSEAIREASATAEARRQSAELDDALTRYKPKG